jgi:RNA polymerase sigma-B factor
MPDNKKNRVLFKKMLQSKQENNIKQYYFWRDKIIIENIELVYWLSKKFFYTRLPSEDITQVGIIGLVNAIERFDLTKSTRFSSFAVPTILGEIKRHIRDKGSTIHVPRRVYENKIKISKILHESNYSLNTDAILKTNPELTKQDVIDYINDLSRNIVSSDYLAESGYQMRNLSVEPVNDILIFIDRQISKFSEQEQRVIRLYYIENYTQVEIAKKIGHSQMHISRLLKRITQKLSEKEKQNDE